MHNKADMIKGVVGGPPAAKAAAPTAAGGALESKAPSPSTQALKISKPGSTKKGTRAGRLPRPLPISATSLL